MESFENKIIETITDYVKEAKGVYFPYKTHDNEGNLTPEMETIIGLLKAPYLNNWNTNKYTS